MQKILESIEIKPGHLRSDSDDYAEKFITLRVRPGRRPGRSTRNQGMYSPMTKAEADKVCLKTTPSCVEGSLLCVAEICSRGWLATLAMDTVYVQSGVYVGFTTALASRCLPSICGALQILFLALPLPTWTYLSLR